MDQFKTRWQLWRRKDICAAVGEPEGTWLHIRRAADGPCAGCIICERKGFSTPWAQFTILKVDQFQLCKVAKHSASRLHRLAMAGNADAPSADQWEQALQNFRSARRGTKEHAMRWCLNEGLRIVQWYLLVGRHAASTISLSQDGRNHRLLMRLQGSSVLFEKFSFTVGQVRLSGTDSYAVAATTMSLLRKFATALRNVPPYGGIRGELPQQNLQPNPDVLNQLLAKTEALVTDAASDEMKAGRLLMGREESIHIRKTLTNIKFHCCCLSGPPFYRARPKPGPEIPKLRFRARLKFSHIPSVSLKADRGRAAAGTPCQGL